MAKALKLKKYNGREGVGNFVALTVEEAKALKSGDHVWYYLERGDTVRVKVNGKPKTWKRTPERVEVPVKYGLYEYGRVDSRQILNGVLLKEV